MAYCSSPAQSESIDGGVAFLKLFFNFSFLWLFKVFLPTVFMQFIEVVWGGVLPSFFRWLC